jgi:lipopolysaccharide/colanic/teichoic acid biosynthesis glycosyltransferase
MKRVFDLVLGLVGILLTGPFLLLLAVWVKLDSPGPAFYCGVRAGRFGKPFRIYKLRTMVQDAENLGGRAETPADDPRITRAGAFLRRWKLDEFPQLLNVIRGEMSLVGPRPEVMEEVEKYNSEEMQLLLVRPGLTDRASIKFRHEGELLRGSKDPHLDYRQRIRPEKIRMGLEYVHSNSLMTDCKIVLQTLKVILQ